MEELFYKVVNHIFNNWTALKLAVDHSLRGADSLQTATDILDYMVKYCLYESNAQAEDIQDALDDIMDEEFETICEDNSTKEISILLYRFVQLLKEGNFEQCEVEYNNLPKANAQWLRMSKCLEETAPVQEGLDPTESHGAETSEQTAMEEDCIWTTVKSKRKR